MADLLAANGGDGSVGFSRTDPVEIAAFLDALIPPAPSAAAAPVVDDGAADGGAMSPTVPRALAATVNATGVTPSDPFGPFVAPVGTVRYSWLTGNDTQESPPSMASTDAPIDYAVLPR